MGRLGIDFGTSTTVIAAWDPTRHESSIVDLREYTTPNLGGEGINAIPSAIAYQHNGPPLVGDQVLRQSLYDNPNTFRDMKAYAAGRFHGSKNIGGRWTSYTDAGRDFLKSVLSALWADMNVAWDEEIALTVPVEAFEDFDEWLLSVAESAAGYSRIRLLDEATAAALGYQANIEPNEAFLVFDLGGGSLNVSVVLAEEDTASAGSRRCRVLGKAGADDVGGRLIDEWLCADVLRSAGREPYDPGLRLVQSSLRAECERAKIRLSSASTATVTVIDPSDGHLLVHDELSRGRLVDVLRQNRLFERINRIISEALSRASQGRGYEESSLKTVLMIGGSSFIPSVQAAIRDRFGADRVHFERPFDAVARGAAAFVAGVPLVDHVQHDYAIRFIDAQTGERPFRTLVGRGTHYPTSEPEAITVKAIHPNQTELGIEIYELSDAAGIDAARRSFWMNERNPTFLKADPPAQPGDPGFEVLFSVDANKRLIMTARDKRSVKYQFEDFPVVRLT